ncbi:MAG: hypothetical protein ACYS47_20675 [Planctomycetota bacterium]|jgi:Spy/CpxP family protein refolding chaperone
MKRIETMAILLIAALAFLVPARVFGEEGEPAQPPEPEPREGGEGRERKERRNRQDRGLRQLIKELGLDEEQVQKFKEIMKESQKTIQETLKKATEDREAKIREILTEEQAAKFGELSKRRSRGRGPMGGAQGGRQRPGGQGRMGGPAGDLLRVILRELDLSPEQRDKVIEIIRDMQVRMEELMREARGEGGDPEAVREKMQALQKDLLEKIQPILSPDQQEKLEEIRKKVAKRIRGDLDRRGGRNRGQPGQGDPEAMLKRRLQKIRGDLKVEIPEVWAVLGEKIEKILRAEMDFRKQLRDQTRKLRELMQGEGEVEDERLEKGLEGLRELRKNHQEVLKTLRSDLRELLNLQEEAKLVMHGVLD